VLQLIGLIPIDAAAVPQNGSATVSLSTAPSTLLAPQTQLQFSSQPASVYTIASIDADTLTLTLTGNFTGPSGATGMVISRTTSTLSGPTAGSWGQPGLGRPRSTSPSWCKRTMAAHCPASVLISAGVITSSSR
jgi:hypothetical protein